MVLSTFRIIFDIPYNPKIRLEIWICRLHLGPVASFLLLGDSIYFLLEYIHFIKAVSIAVMGHRSKNLH